MKPKKTSVQHHAAFGEGGGGHMLPKQAANPQKPGGTAHAVKGKAPGPKHASGGPQTRGASVSKPARPGRTAPATKGR